MRKRKATLRMKGEAEIENGPVDHFPAERTEQVLCTCETENRGFGASAGCQNRTDS